MRYFKHLICCIIIILSASGCKDSGSPESITELFIISYKNLDFVTLKNISTKNTRDLLKIYEYYAKDSAVVEEWQNKYDKIKIKIVSKEFENDTTVFVQFSTDPDILPINEIKLVQVSEKLDKKSWKIDLSTLEMMEREQLDAVDTNTLRESYDGQIHPDADSVSVQE